MTAAPNSQLVEKVAKAIADARGHGMREKEVVAAQASLAACEFDTMLSLIQRMPLDTASDAFLRERRALLARLEGKP